MPFSRNCPHCRHAHLYASKSPAGGLAWLLFLRRVRCGQCRQQAWVFSLTPPPIRPPAGPGFEPRRK